MTRSLNLGAALLMSAMLGACASTQPGDTSKPAAGTPAAADARAADSTKPTDSQQTSTQGQTAAQTGSQTGQSTQAQGARNAMPAQRSIYYDFDKYAVKGEFASIVQVNAAYLKDNAAAKVRIEGNCDERGSRSYNLALGQRRADAVKSAMKLLGVAEQRIETVSYGEEKPKSAGSSETAWSENRRSDLVYQNN